MKNQTLLSNPQSAEERTFLALISDLIRSENTRNLVLGVIGAIFCTCVFVISTQSSLATNTRAIQDFSAWKEAKDKNDNALKIQLIEVTEALNSNSKAVSALTEAFKRIEQRQWEGRSK